MLSGTLGRALRDFRKNLLLQVICAGTIALSVFIVSAFALFYINATALLDAWKKGARIIAYLEEGVSSAERSRIMQTISALPGVAGIDFIDKETAFLELQQKIGGKTSLLEGLEENPLPDAMEVRLADKLRDMAVIDRLAARIAALPQINEVEYARKWMGRFAGFYQLFKVTGGVLAGMFFIATLLIVSNTIRLIMSQRSEEIRIMRIVGAQEGFIKYPLYIEAVLQGLGGAVVGLVFLYTAYGFALKEAGGKGGFAFFDIRFLPASLFAGIIISSMIIGWLGCYLSIRRFLSA